MVVFADRRRSRLASMSDTMYGCVRGRAISRGRRDFGKRPIVVCSWQTDTSASSSQLPGLFPMSEECNGSGRCKGRVGTAGWRWKWR